MTSLYPIDYQTLTTWAEENGFTQEGARSRFAQYLVLSSIATVAPLRQTIVFKGGNALDFVWSPNRSTLDLDFSIDHTKQTYEATAHTLKQLLTPGLASTAQRHNSHLAVNSIHPTTNPAKDSLTTFQVNIGYALPEQISLLQRIARGFKSTQVIRLEISLNEPICDSTFFTLNDSEQPIRISTLEDIFAEKLRSLLQQPIRNRERKQDVLDIALILRNHPNLDSQTIGAYLITKATARDVPFTRTAFHHPEIATRAAKDYEQLQTTARQTFIPFDEAFAALLAFTDTLPIPE